MNLAFDALKSTAKSKVRLWLEYLLILLVLISGGLAVYATLRNATLKVAMASLAGDLVKEKARVDQVEAANEKQAQAISTMETIRALDGQVLTSMQIALQTVSNNDRTINTRILELEKNSAEVRAYLDANVPAGCMLDNTCGANGNKVPGTQPGAAGTVRRSGAGGDANGTRPGNQQQR